MTLIELLQEYEIPFRQSGDSPHVTQGWVGVECPFCGIGTGKYGMGINTRVGSCSCWKCGVHRLYDVLHEITRLPYHELRSLLSGFARRDDRPTHRGKLRLPQGAGPLLPPHRDYLRSRGFADPDQLASLWGLAGIGLAARLAWRIFIPASLSGKTLSWTTRSIADDCKLRYISAKPEEEIVPLKSLLFGLDLCRHAILVTEGPMDAMRIGPGAVCTFGLSYTQAQVRTIATFPIRAVVFDNESGALRRARKLCDDLAAFPGQTHYVEIDSPDPGSASPKEVNRLRKAFLE